MNTIHINSAVLAVKSPFFYKVGVVNLSCDASNMNTLIKFCILIFDLQLFSNGMMESEQRVATLQIHASGIYKSDWLNVIIHRFFVLEVKSFHGTGKLL